MTVLDKFDINRIRYYVDIIKDNINYLEEYGYATSYKEVDDIVADKYEKICELLNQSITLIEDISQIACDNFDN